ncbi:uncharacterized protein LOC105197307 [Solenopsis invicta]|uniref:uncharacterized protein LOC105197307 n=1 Tax=Solenopsis invicta TaxID=13686 RepID=UPI00193D7382|nr:uncharacterized protein LOC105197307 [Solenopsis invicta]
MLSKMGRMKIAWLPALIFCATLASVAAGLDLGPIIKTAQCCSTCLRRYTINGTYMERNGSLNYNSYMCWVSCDHLSVWNKEDRAPYCNIFQNCEGCKTACTFYKLREEEEYETTKLPAPEENKTIHINDYDIAVLMQKNWKGIWEVKSYRFSKQQLTIKPGDWIIVVTDDGVVKHYSWEKWRPKLQVLKAGGPLYQAYITWQDWRTQLKNQRERIISNGFKGIFQDQYQSKKETTIYEYQREPSFVITWQQETGDGIMGNQVTDSESAQISLSCGKYLVRVATDNGPGSYPIVIDTCKIPEISIWDLKEYINGPQIMILIYLIILSAIGFSCVILCLFQKYRTKNEKESCMEEGRLTKEEKKLIKEKNLMQKKLINQGVLRLWPNYNQSTLDLLWVKRADMNVNASTQNTSASVIQNI